MPLDDIRLFVAYSPRDSDKVSHVMQSLKCYNVSFWWDMRDARPGVRLDSEIFDAYFHAHGILAFDSPNSQEEGWPKYLHRYMTKYAQSRVYWITFTADHTRLDGHYCWDEGVLQSELFMDVERLSFEIDEKWGHRMNFQPLGVVFKQDPVAEMRFLDPITHHALEAAKEPWRIGTKEAVFISYRRSESPRVARALYEKLCVAIGPHNVFMDVEDQPSFGRNVQEYLQSLLKRSCDRVDRRALDHFGRRRAKASWTQPIGSA